MAVMKDVPKSGRFVILAALPRSSSSVTLRARSFLPVRLAGLLMHMPDTRQRLYPQREPFPTGSVAACNYARGGRRVDAVRCSSNATAAAPEKAAWRVRAAVASRPADPESISRPNGRHRRLLSHSGIHVYAPPPTGFCQ
ncbi:hypothetical protein EYF80_048409 [Liparis tanakae]|uniref:Uncharacterized protein n=1 Tax=Liparis tanakae TaxID=230148 RepID=A0A4Z2FKY0_9TELE|nr:hypothetical protein EYF80_048409 [Liparis tanakae]